MDDSIARFSTTEVTLLLSRSRGTIQSLARRHRLGIRVANRKYLFSAEDVERLRELVNRQSTDPPGTDRSTSRELTPSVSAT